NAGMKQPTSALQLGPRKRLSLPDPLVHHGQHFGRTIYAFANVNALLLAGLSASVDEPPETQQCVLSSLTFASYSNMCRLLRELRVYSSLMSLVPTLEDGLLESSEEEVMFLASLIQKGANSARSDDTKTLKSVIIDWITPLDGEPLRPTLHRHIKVDRGFNHERTGYFLCPAGTDWSDPIVKSQLKDKELVMTGAHWPLFLYQNEKYDPEEPWRGLCKGFLLVKAFKHIFTSPSSVNNEPRATRSGNARLHGMSAVTPASIAYVATQVRFALSSASVFSRTDRETDSETFYTSLLELLEDPEEKKEIKELLDWWNRQIFPSFSTVKRIAPANSALAKIKEKR
ncbi:hypothetical protein FA15DRAFT_560127, partial [Coprinopsis marcescibilis]